MNTHDPISEELLARYLAKTATENEIKHIDLWLAASDENKREFEGYKVLWEQTQIMRQGRFRVNTDAAWNNIKTRINTDPPQPEIKRLNSHPPQTILKNSKPSPLMWAAAMVAALMMSFGWYMMKPAGNKSVRIETAANTREEILPDGSKVFLNYNSALTYPEHFEGKERTVSLIGEAFFEIQPDAAHPFAIDANGTEVSVLGTSFNVKAYPKDPVRVDVATGKVAVTKGKTSLKLVQGESAEVIEDTVRSILPDINKMSYRTQTYDFVATDLENVVSTIRRGYHIDLRLSDQKAAQCRLTIRFEKEPVDATLAVIAETMNLKVRKEGDVYWLDGHSCQ
jgi:transmembrane sensor